MNAPTTLVRIMLHVKTISMDFSVTAIKDMTKMMMDYAKVKTKHEY